MKLSIGILSYAVIVVSICAISLMVSNAVFKRDLRIIVEDRVKVCNRAAVNYSDSLKDRWRKYTPKEYEDLRVTYLDSCMKLRFL